MSPYAVHYSVAGTEYKKLWGCQPKFNCQRFKIIRLNLVFNSWIRKLNKQNSLHKMEGVTTAFDFRGICLKLNEKAIYASHPSLV